jgi:hypothetical protein
MANTILCQIVSLFPRHEFEVLAKMYHVGQKFRSFNRWSQFLAMAIAQISSRKSLRDVVSNIGAQRQRILSPRHEVDQENNPGTRQ